MYNLTQYCASSHCLYVLFVSKQIFSAITCFGIQVQNAPHHLSLQLQKSLSMTSFWNRFSRMCLTVKENWKQNKEQQGYKLLKDYLLCRLHENHFEFIKMPLYMSNVKQRGNPLFFKTKTKLLKKYNIIQHGKTRNCIIERKKKHVKNHVGQVGKYIKIVRETKRERSVMVHQPYSVL